MSEVLIKKPARREINLHVWDDDLLGYRHRRRTRCAWAYEYLVDPRFERQRLL